MSLAEFLEWDDGTDTRYELIDGRPVAMAPPAEAHGTIVANIVAPSARGSSRPAGSWSRRGSSPPIAPTPGIRRIWS